EALKARSMSRKENTRFLARHKPGNLTIWQPASYKQKYKLTSRTSSLGQLRRVEYSKHYPGVHMIRRKLCGRPAISPHSLSMNNDSPSNRLTRREFLNQTAAGVAASTVVGSALGSSIARAVESSEKIIGIQVGSISFVDEGIEQVLDLLRQRGAVYTVVPITFTYGPGL